MLPLFAKKPLMPKKTPKQKNKSTTDLTHQW